MKLVTFSKTMAPHGVGDTRLVSDTLARQLQAEGFVSSAEPWPAPSAEPLGADRPSRGRQKPVRPVVRAAQRMAR